MRNMLAFVAALLITLGAVGFYLGWFNVHSAPGPEGNTSFRLDVNTNKIGEDIRKAEEKLQQRLAENSKSGETASKKEKTSTEQQSQKSLVGKKNAVEKKSGTELPPMPGAVSDVGLIVDR